MSYLLQLVFSLLFINACGLLILYIVKNFVPLPGRENKELPKDERLKLKPPKWVEDDDSA